MLISVITLKDEKYLEMLYREFAYSSFLFTNEMNSLILLIPKYRSNVLFFSQTKNCIINLIKKSTNIN